MVTYKEKTQTWKFGPPYPRGVWLFEILAILVLTGAIAFTNPFVLTRVLESLFFHLTYYSRQFSSPVVSILLIVVAVSIPRLAFVYMYLPRVVHLTYDEIVVTKGFGRFMRKRILYCDIEALDLIYCDKFGWTTFLLSPFYWIFMNLYFQKMDRVFMSDRTYKVNITLKNERIVELQVENPERFIDLVEERMEKFRPQHRDRQR